MSRYSFVFLSKFINNDQIEFESKGTGFKLMYAPKYEENTVSV